MGARSLRPLQSVVVAAALALAAPVASQGREDPAALLQLWWNDANVVAVLGLDAETRGAMDTAYRTYAVDGSAKAMRRRRTAFKSALLQGDWEQAKAALAGIAEPTIREGTLKIETLQLLSPEQHAILVASASRPSFAASGSRRAAGGMRARRRTRQVRSFSGCGPRRAGAVGTPAPTPPRRRLWPEFSRHWRARAPWSRPAVGSR